ncbi:MAG: EamA family transporter, partial [Prochlorococcaceae cyanobacterium ETNP7_MAG_30]|nr:EamA family transporter [Prochlorococcaceae cyanobacterium ETNP7_MAG_30]
LFGSALAYGLFFWFANREELTSFSSLAFLTPVFALAAGGFWLGERLQPLQWFGVGLVLLSVLVVSLRRRIWEPAEVDSDLFSEESGG